MVQHIVMPYAYFICGVGFVSNFDCLFTFLLGDLLMLLSCLIWLKRQEPPHSKSYDSAKQT
jgi:hypothetical protein